jgi:hypothetical protein
MKKIISSHLIKSLALSIGIFGIAVIISLGAKFILDYFSELIKPGYVILLVSFSLLWANVYIMYSMYRDPNDQNPKN